MSLSDVVASLHGGSPRWLETAPVRLEGSMGLVWEGDVEVFALDDHAQADRAFAWEEPPETEGGKARVFAVLAVPPVVTAEDAVRASIVQRVRETRRN